MNGTNKAIVGVVFGIALIYSALCLMLTLQNIADTGIVSAMVFLPHGGELGIDLGEYLGPLGDVYNDFVCLFTDFTPGMEKTVAIIVVILGFMLSVIGMFTKPTLDCNGTDNPAQYMFTHRPKAFSRCVLAPFGLITACWSRHKALVVLPVVLLPFYVHWSVLIAVCLVIPFALMRAVKGSQIKSAGKKEGKAYEVETMYAVCPICKRNFARPKVKCRCGLILDYPVPNEYGVKYHTCNKGHDISCRAGKRSELTTVCPYCNEVIETREAKPISIAMVGAVGSGKTTMMLAAVKEITAAARTRDITVEAVTPGISKSMVAAKDVVPKSAPGELDSECMFVRSRSMPEKEIVFNDISGQEFEPKEDKVLFEEYFNYADGIVFAYDPIALRAGGRGATPEETFESFHSMYTIIKNISPAKVNNVPFAIVATKKDLFNPPLSDADARSILMNHGQENFVKVAESLFSDIMYFSVSSVGDECSSAAKPIWWIVGKSDKELHDAVPLR